MRARPIILAVSMVAALGVAATWLWNRSQPEVETVRVTRGPAAAAVYATGIVEPVLWARIAPSVKGRLVEILARDNDQVERGQALARLDDREAQGRLREHEAREAFWREELQRETSLQARGFSTREARDRAQSELLQIQAAIAQQRQRISDLTLVSPLAGAVLRQDGEIGEMVDTNQVLFWVGQPRPLRITADVDEEDIPRVKPGQRALIKADAFPRAVLEGTLAEITPKGDPVNKNYRVRVALPDDTPLLVGMTAEVNVVVREVADALLVPAAAVRRGQSYVVEGGVARLRRVEVGISGRDLVEVLSGLALGEEVVLNPPEGLADGTRVRASGAGAAAATRR